DGMLEAAAAAAAAFNQPRSLVLAPAGAATISQLQAGKDPLPMQPASVVAPDATTTTAAIAAATAPEGVRALPAMPEPEPEPPPLPPPPLGPPPPPPPPPPHQQQQQLQRQSGTTAPEVLSALALLQALPQPQPPMAQAAPHTAAVPEPSPPVAPTIRAHETPPYPSSSAPPLPLEETQGAFDNAADQPPFTALRHDFAAARCVCCSRPCHLTCMVAGKAAEAEREQHQARSQVVATHGSEQQPLPPSRLMAVCPNGEVPWVSTAAADAATASGLSFHPPISETGLRRPSGRNGDPHGAGEQKAERQAEAVAPGGDLRLAQAAVVSGQGFVCSVECRALMRELRQMLREGCRRLKLECDRKVLLGLGRSTLLEW
ncbi:hypothetical protein Vretifemale_18825, partial [Volvox reticuliferus]